MTTIDVWLMDILMGRADNVPDWHSRDKAYWKALFKEVNRTMEMPERPDICWYKVEGCALDSMGLPFALAAPTHIDDKKETCWSWPSSPAGWVRYIRFLKRVAKDNPNVKRGGDATRDYGKVVGPLLDAKISAMLRDVGDPCINNIRFARMSSSGDMKRYKRARNTGCCGFRDQKVSVLGTDYIIGCNYGH